MTLADALKKAGLPVAPISVREVWLVKDEILKFPEGKKTEEETRRVLVLNNTELCRELNIPIVTVAPLSSKVRWKTKAELFFAHRPGNGLSKPSRLMLSHMQPLMKGDLEKKLGQFNDEEWDEVIDHLIWNIEGR